MKTKLTYLLMIIMTMTMALGFTSCGDDDDEKGTGGLNGTQWVYVDKYVDGTIEYIVNFGDGTATYEITIRNAGGTITDTELIYYSYRVSEDLVVFTTEQAGKANLEGLISSGIKMVLTNTSTGQEIGTFYKQ
ncbi:hypothetical protein [Parabacteroides johnsonii]|uniref:hypothetical protein n=1 Tax=Parabacteroides johnsonii TaxID=387661 RepID=UPI00189BCAE5|nr:hypothetical protein [Parabacteroides johnsonii]